MENETVNKQVTANSDLGTVNGCFSSLEYRQLNNNKGKQRAFVNGWNMAEKGLPETNCPYSPKVKDFLPTCPYYKSWHSGYQAFLINFQNRTKMSKKERKTEFNTEKTLSIADVMAMLPSSETIEANGIEGGLRDGELQMYWEGATWLKNHLQKRLLSKGN